MHKCAHRRPTRRQALKVNEPLEVPRRQPLHEPPPAVYLLKAWTLREKNGKWFAAHAAHHGDKPEWKGPYQSLDNAAKAIARAITQEVAARHNRCIDFYGDKA
jgi:hypothetical protein